MSSKGKIQMDVGPMGIALGGWGHAILSLLRVVLRHSETVSSPSSCGVTDQFFANVCCPGEMICCTYRNSGN